MMGVYFKYKLKETVWFRGYINTIERACIEERIYREVLQDNGCTGTYSMYSFDNQVEGRRYEWELYTTKEELLKSLDTNEEEINGNG